MGTKLHDPPEELLATGVVVALTAVLALITIAFALPAAKSTPHDIPIGAVGQPAASGRVTDLLERNMPGAFALTVYPTEAALRSAIRDRDVYGGIVLESDPPTVLTATGASPTIAQLLTLLDNRIAQQSGVPLRSEDLAPPPGGDPRGTGLAAAALPITLAGFLPATLLTLVVRRQAWIRVAATAVFAGLAGTTIAVLICWAVVGSLIIVIAMQRRAFQATLGDRLRAERSISQADYLNSLATQPNRLAPRAVRTPHQEVYRDLAIR